MLEIFPMALKKGQRLGMQQRTLSRPMYGLRLRGAEMKRSFYGTI